MSTNTTMGTSLATVTTRLTAAACCTPRRTTANDAHRPTLATSTVMGVSPAPSAGIQPPRVEAMSTQYVTLPTHADAQYPNAEKKPRYSPNPALA